MLYGDLAAPEVWAELDAYLLTPTIGADGREMAVSATAIDSGGHYTDAVYNFVRDKSRRRVWAIKGQGGEGKPVWPKLASKNNKGRIALFNIGVDSAKDIIYGRLRIASPGPGYCHFPMDRDGSYFEQLTSEIVITKYVRGFPVRSWVPKPNTRQEALDCRVYRNRFGQQTRRRQQAGFRHRHRRPPGQRLRRNPGATGRFSSAGRRGHL